MDIGIGDFVARVIDETPEGTVIWRAVSHAYTREEMIEEIESRSDVGMQYVTELLRVSRDLIARSAGRVADFPADDQKIGSGIYL